MTILSNTSTSALQSTGARHLARNVTALVASLALTAGVLVSLSTLVGTWA